MVGTWKVCQKCLVKYRLIDRQIKFKYYAGYGNRRFWLMNYQYHRDDDGPAIEAIETGNCVWYKHGVSIRNNHEA